jgi:protein ImuA
MSQLTALRRAIAALEPPAVVGATDLFSFGLAQIDDALGGGLKRGALHEVYARQTMDAAAAEGFGLCLAIRAAGERPLVWARQDFSDVEAGVLHGEGISAFGGDPGRLLVVRPRDATGVLKAANEAARCPALGAVLAEVWGSPKSLDLKTSRRLGLAAAVSGVTLVMIRGDAEPQASAAMSRWSIAAAASSPLEANAPGPPAFEAALLRHRAGVAPSAWRVEWDRDRLSFAAAPLPRIVVPVPADRPAAAAGEPLWRRAG